MVQEIKNDSIDLISTHFARRDEPNVAWGNAISMIYQLPGLRAFYPMGVVFEDATYTYVKDIAIGYSMQILYEGTPPQIYTEGLVTYMKFAAGLTGNYCTVGSDQQTHDILGTEPESSADLKGLTIGGWVRPQALEGILQGIFSKYGTVGNYAYRLNISTTDQFLFRISGNGTTQVSITNSSVSPVVGTWYFVTGRYKYDATTPKIDISVNLQTDTNSTSIPSAINNTSTPLMLAATDGAGANLFQGDLSLMFLCSTYVPDVNLFALYQQTRAMFGHIL